MAPAVSIRPSPPMNPGAGTNDNVYPRLHVRIAGLSDGENAPISQSYINVDDAPVIHDKRIGNDGVHGALARAR